MRKPADRVTRGNRPGRNLSRSGYIRRLSSCRGSPAYQPTCCKRSHQGAGGVARSEVVFSLPRRADRFGCGRTFRPHAELLLRTAALARQAVHELQPSSGTPLQIAAALSISVYFLPDILKRFQRAHPHVIISIRPGHSKEVLDMVLSEEAEIGLARSLQHPEVETISLRDDPLLLVAHPTRSPKHTRRARLEQVASWPLIFYDRGSSDWTLTHSLFRTAGLVPNVALEVDSIETAKRMVERGLGLSFLPQIAVGKNFVPASSRP